MLELARQRKWLSTTRQSRQLGGSMHSLVFWQQEVGIKRSKWVVPAFYIIHVDRDYFQYWDLRASAPIASITLPERCYSFDVQYPLMVVGTAERHMQIYNLTNPTTAYKVLHTLLRRAVTNLLKDDYFSAQMANPSSFLLHRIRK